MQLFIALFRAFRLALHIGYGLTVALVYPRLPAALRRRILQRWSADLLHIFNVELDAGELRVPHCGLIVSNHVSWLDIYALNAVVPMRFVAKSEVRRWPVIGWLCARAQTLFIERGSARAAARINGQLCELMRQGECLAVFPEGTSTDGAQVAHFHASLLQPAIDAGVTLHPVAIRYQSQDGARSTAAVYCGDISFGSSLWTLLNTEKLRVRLLPAPSLPAADFERRELAQRAHDSISAALQLAASHKLHIALTDPQHSDTNLLTSTT
jgi:1-acyl-sn-glycerol-3-phosphate acyltransferase